MTNSPTRLDSPVSQRKLALADTFRAVNWPIVMLTAILCIVGWLLFRQFADYQYMSDRHVADILRAKLWSILWLLISFGLVYWKRHSPIAPLLAVLAVSAYFVVLYGILFRGTEYGMNGHWGDNGNRLAEICKMMYYGSFFQDWYLKDLPSFYPPGWFALMAVYAKVLGIEAYQTVKWGYLLIFLAYPWLLYFAWRKLVSPVAAAAVVLATMFFGYRYLDWIYYEHITAALFIPWWLYYFEDGRPEASAKLWEWKFYTAGAVWGGLLCMTYYYWFFMAAAVLPVTLIARYVKTKSLLAVGRDLVHKSVLMCGVAIVSAVYWLPLFRSIYWAGSESAQNQWFGIRHANLTYEWKSFSVEGVLVLAGLSLAFYLWNRFGRGKLPLLFLGGILVIVGDRFMNLGLSSSQSRKVIELAHVFAMAPLAIGAITVWLQTSTPVALRRAGLGLFLVLLLVVSNDHTELYGTSFYRIAIGQRVPQTDLEAFKAVNTDNMVFLTSHYLECCYLPYYLFIPYNNMTSHTAGRYSQRELFLQEAAKIEEPELLAYALAHNRYSPIDYVYLPLDTISGRWLSTLYQAACFENSTGHPIHFAADHRQAPAIFVERHERGVFEIVAELRNASTDQDIKTKYPDIYWHLQPRDW